MIKHTAQSEPIHFCLGVFEDMAPKHGTCTMKSEVNCKMNHERIRIRLEEVLCREAQNVAHTFLSTLRQKLPNRRFCRDAVCCASSATISGSPTPT